MKKAISLLAGLVLWSAVLTGSALAAGPAAFTLHLECEDGSTFDLDAPVGNSFAALVRGSNSVGVLKGQDSISTERRTCWFAGSRWMTS